MFRVSVFDNVIQLHRTVAQTYVHSDFPSFALQSVTLVFKAEVTYVHPLKDMFERLVILSISTIYLLFTTPLFIEQKKSPLLPSRQPLEPTFL